MPDNGLISIESKHTVRDTINRLETALAVRGITIFARIDHAAGATSVNMLLRPTEVLIFGNPKAGTPLMQNKQIIGLDLPLKVLGWEDAAGKVWLSYNNLGWLAQRYQLSSDADAVVEALAKVLVNVTEVAAA